MQQLRLIADGLPVQVVEAAVGAVCGLATLHIADKVEPTSTLSTAFMARMENWDERYKQNWRRQLVVPTVTLDSLIAHFGQPAYVKIDVEGFELDVLRGLSSYPPPLSFEFHNADLESACTCLDRFTEDSEFNLISNSAWGYHEKLDCENWRNRTEFKNHLTTLTSGNIEGDIFVRRPAIPGLFAKGCTIKFFPLHTYEEFVCKSFSCRTSKNQGVPHVSGLHVGLRFSHAVRFSRCRGSRGWMLPLHFLKT